MKKQKTNELNIILVDLETSPNLSWTWGKWEQNVIDFERETHILCFAYKKLGERQTHAYALRDFKRYKKDKEDDYFLVKKMHEVFCDADIIIAQNGDNFDIKMANTAFIRNGLTPPTPIKTIDTLKIAKSKFKFNSNKLDDLGKILGLGRKVDTGGFNLWKGCMNGEKKSWDKMIRYNKQDVVLLEKIYNKLKPWATNHPNINRTFKADTCQVCGSKHVEQRGWSYLLRQFHAYVLITIFLKMGDGFE